MDSKYNFHELEKLLLSLPKVDTRDKETFLNVYGIPNHENAISNIYSFFLQKGNHGFGTLFLDALNDCIEHTDLSMSSYEVLRESYTLEGGRIDIQINEKVIDNKPFKSIFIENKIYHDLNNNLEDYLNSLDNKSEKIGIVLTLEPDHNVRKPFLNITHKTWITNIQKRIGAYIDKADSKYLLLLQDFISHINSFYTKHLNMNTIEFLYRNGEKINQLHQIDIEGLNHVAKEIKNALTKTEWSWGRLNSWEVSISRENSQIYLYIYLGDIFAKHQFTISLFLKGEKIVNKWNETDYYKRTETIAQEKNIHLAEDPVKNKFMVCTADKEYKISDSKQVFNFSAFLEDILLNDWEPLVKAICTNFKINA